MDMILLLLHLLTFPVVIGQNASAQACKIVLTKMDCSIFPKDPICGSDDKEYANHCEFATAHCQTPSIHIKVQGLCIDATTTQQTVDPLCEVFVTAICPSEQQQMCGTNNITYQNLCIYHKERCHNPSLSISYRGPCGAQTTTVETTLTHRETTIATTTSTPEVTTEMTTVDTLCLAILQSKCGTEINEVCGTDGKTYRNRCEFQKGKCNDPNLLEDPHGGCPTIPTPTMSALCQALMLSACGIDREETCGSDGKMYLNGCEFQKAQCKNPDLIKDPHGGCQPATTIGTTIKLTVTLDFLCQAIVQAQCGNEVEQVCGTDGKTYRNACEFEKGKCYYPQLTEFSKGVCKTTTVPTTTPTTTTTHSTTTLDFLCQAIIQSMCGPEVKEMCGTDGKTYRNACEFQKGKCYNPSLDQKQTNGAACEAASVTVHPTNSPKPTSHVNLTPVEVVCKTLMHYTCPPETEQLCATDGVTYRNDCEYEKAKCTHHNLHVKNFGPCR